MNTLFIVVGAVVLLWLIGNIIRKVQNKNRIVHVVAGNCTGCGRCVTNMRKCKHNVLTLVSNENGKHIEVKHPNKCTACGDCVSLCKFNALEFE